MTATVPPVRFGLIGCGRAAELLHAPAFAQVAGAQLVAAADPLPERATAVIAAAGTPAAACAAFDSPEALLRSGGIDAVIVATPPETRLAVAELVFDASLPALVEKPLAATLADAERIAALASAASIPVMIGYNRRWWRPVAELRRRLAGWRENGPISARMVMTSDFRGWGAICGVRDPLDDLVTHQLDLLRFIFDSEIAAVGARCPREGEVCLEIELAGGLAVACRAAQGDVSAERIEVEHGGRRYVAAMGSLRLTPASGPARALLDAADRVRRRIEGRRSVLAYSYEEQLRGFIAHIRNGTAPEPGIADALAAARAVEAARRSIAANGRRIAS